jgi:hypothetical protein
MRVRKAGASDRVERSLCLAKSNSLSCLWRAGTSRWKFRESAEDMEAKYAEYSFKESICKRKKRK